MAAVSNIASKPIHWQKVLVLTLAFWLSSSLFLDLILMPSLYAAGMMTQPGFAPAGYGLFWVFNRLQLILAATVLTGVLAQRFSDEARKASPLVVSVVLLLATLICTYFLAPQMSLLGLNLNWFEAAEVPIAMNQLHISYWLVEGLKLAVGGWLLVQNLTE